MKDQIVMLLGAFRVVFGGAVTAPEFNSKGAALAYLDALQRGVRRAEYPV